MTMTETYECVIQIMIYVCFKIIYVWFYFLMHFGLLMLPKGERKMGILEIKILYLLSFKLSINSKRKGEREMSER